MVEVFGFVLGIKMSESMGLKPEQKYTNYTSVHGLFSSQRWSPITSNQKLRYFLVPFLQTRFEDLLATARKTKDASQVV